jgi:hypothetical protein
MSRYRIDPKSGKTLVLNEKTGKWRPDRAKANKFDPSKPMNFMPDIAEVVVNATDKPVVLTSRSQRAAYCRANNIREAGDFKRGEIAERQARKVRQEIEAVTKLTGIRPGKTVNWSDFR